MNDTRLESSNLTDRQKALYLLIYSHSFGEHKVLTQKEICDALPEFYTYKKRENSSDCCTMLWSDINAINQCPDVDHIIITNKYTYWIGSREETKAFKNDYWRKEIAPRLERWWNFTRKSKKDGQGDLLLTEEEDKDTVFHSAFNSYNIELQKEEESATENQ